MRYGPERRLVRKVVGYVVQDEQLLVFAHDDVPLEVAGIQVPAGSVEPGEEPADAVVREVAEETGIDVRVVASLGTGEFDVWPSKPEVHERHFFQLEPIQPVRDVRWAAGEDRPSDGGGAQSWTCFWIPLTQGHVLCAGFSARLGQVVADTTQA
ncbi:NUDIX domain-containing protein [Mycolicibacterium phlei]|uniref:NUDIX hydrolase n=1 Tax=Mycolicibacterium phlei TaxID=1771 RepID=UPI0037CB3F6C